MNIKDLKNVYRELECYIGEEETLDNLIQFAYRPNAITPEWQDKLNNVTEEDMKSDDFISSLCDILVKWDVYDFPPEEGGKIIEISKDNIQELKGVPYVIYSAMMDKIGEDQKPKKKERVGSLIG